MSTLPLAGKFPVHRGSGIPAAPVSTFPFQLTNASTGTTLKVSVAPGFVNGQYPTGMDAATPTVLTIAATAYLWLKVVGTFGAPDTYVVTIQSTTGASPASDEVTGTGFVSCQLIGVASVAGGAVTVTNVLKSNCGVDSIGTINVWWKSP